MKGERTMAFDNIQPDAIDLFCGAGGLSLGLENAGIHVCVGVEVNKIAAQTYRNNLNGAVLEEDIREITDAQMKEALGKEEGELFLLAGCPPCQTFSSLQKTADENDERNSLIFEYIRFVNALKPLFIQLENVPGLKTGKGKNVFALAESELKKDYELVSDVLNCADYGIPQHRRRLVLHGIRKDVYRVLLARNPEFKVKLPAATHTSNVTANPELLPWVASAAAFANLPSVKAGEPAPTGFPNHETLGLSEINIDRIRYIRANGGSRTCLPENLQLKCHKKGVTGFTDVYGIIDPSLPAPTMTGGCIVYSKGRYGHPYQDRAITVREAARIQSFPDTYVFSGKRGQAALQVGNAVPPALAEASGRYFLDLLNQLHNIQ